jgi:rubrerythrin
MGAFEFSAGEILVMAEQIERNGAKFYRKAAANDPSSKHLLLELAMMEDKHGATFLAMHQALAGHETESATWDPEGESGEYARVLANQHVFDTSKDPSALLTGKETLAEVIKIAIGLEKDSVVFYLGLREMVPPSFGPEKVDLIIKEEMQHIRILSEVKV